MTISENVMMENIIRTSEMSLYYFTRYIMKLLELVSGTKSVGKAAGDKE